MKDDFILKLVDEFEKGQSVVLHIKQGDSELLLKKEGAFPKKENVSTGTAQSVYTFPLPQDGGALITQQPVQQSQPVQPQAKAQAAKETTAAKNIVEIKSPIVGTFYRAPSPDSPPYVEKGSEVKKGQPLCVLEAMKMMNTLESEFDGTIEDILVANGELVEFDQPIFTITTK